MSEPVSDDVPRTEYVVLLRRPDKPNIRLYTDDHPFVEPYGNQAVLVFQEAMLEYEKPVPGSTWKTVTKYDDPAKMCYVIGPGVEWVLKLAG